MPNRDIDEWRQIRAEYRYEAAEEAGFFRWTEFRLQLHVMST
jgi:hypothetical protein